MNNLKYSIIYAVIRPEISEKLSVGLIIVDGNQVDVRYSSHKLNVLQGLFPEKEHEFVAKVVRSLNKSVDSVEAIDYLTRYSNNLIAVSPLQSINIKPTQQNKDWLYRNYVYAK